jgi:DNA-binding NarL/FixJ family response regulator
MADDQIEYRLRAAAPEFIESHQRTEAAIREAVSAGMTGEVIADVSGLSPETVAAFLRQLVQTPNPEES